MSKDSSSRFSIAPLVALGAVGIAIIAWLIMRSGVGGSSPLVAVPEDSFLVLTVDVRAFAQSPVAEALFGKDGKTDAPGARMLGVDALTESCGFNPLTRLRVIALAVPEGGETGDFGIAATGDMAQAELTQCARAMITRRGGDPAVSTQSTFTVVEDSRKPVQAESAPPKVAFRDGGPYLVGSGPWLARMIATAEGRAPSLEKSAAGREHMSLRESLAARDSAARAIILSAVLPKPLRDRLKSEMENEAAQGEQGANNAMAGVLGVASAGLAIHAGGAGEDTSLYAELRCETAEACTAVERLVGKKRFAWSRDFGMRLMGLGPLIDNFDAHIDGHQSAVLLASTRAPSDALLTALERAPPKPRVTIPPRPSASPPPARTPDEVVHAGDAKKDAGAEAGAH